MDVNKITRRLQYLNATGFLSIFIFEYFDKLMLGLGIAFTLSGVLSLVAFHYNADPPMGGHRSRVIFDWLFEHYSLRALNLSLSALWLLVGIICLINHAKNL